MFARASTYHAADPDKLLAGFQSVTDPLEQMDGFSHAYFLVDRASDRAMSITIWENEQALAASLPGAGELRRRGTETGGGSTASVVHYEIGHTVGSPTTAG